MWIRRTIKQITTIIYIVYILFETFNKSMNICITLSSSPRGLALPGEEALFDGSNFLNAPGLRNSDFFGGNGNLDPYK